MKFKDLNVGDIFGYGNSVGVFKKIKDIDNYFDNYSELSTSNTLVLKSGGGTSKGGKTYFSSNQEVYLIDSSVRGFSFSNGIEVKFQGDGVFTSKGTYKRIFFSLTDIEVLRKSLGSKILSEGLSFSGVGDLKIGCEVFKREELKEFLRTWDEYNQK